MRKGVESLCGIVRANDMNPDFDPGIEVIDNTSLSVKPDEL